MGRTSAFDMVMSLRASKSVDVIAEESGVARGTINRISKNPNAAVNQSTYMALVRVYDSYNMSPFPAHTDQLHRHLDQVVADTNSKHKLKQYFELILIPRIKYDPEFAHESFAGVRLQWLLGHVHFELARITEYNEREKNSHVQLAANYYTQAISSLKALDDERFKTLYTAKLSLALFALHFNAKPRDTRVTDPSVIQWLTEVCFVDRVRALLDIEPTNHVAARNGLVGASILKDIEAIDAIGVSLLKRFPNMLKPGAETVPGLPPLNEDTDLVFAYKYLMERYNDGDS